jgi:hypothetical protein
LLEQTRHAVFGRRNVTVTALFILVSTGCVLYSRRESRIENLYVQAGGIASQFRSTPNAEAAVRELAGYRGSRSTDFLIHIAQGRTQIVWPDIQAAAIHALARRPQPEVASAISGLLQPHVSLTVRVAAAETLRTLPCTDPCIDSVLRYLQRIRSGEPNFEDRISNPSQLDSMVRTSRRAEQSHLYGCLREVLKAHVYATINLLRAEYGLGSAAPSLFALGIVEELRLTQACPSVLSSEQQMNATSPKWFDAPRDRTSALASSLGCRLKLMP